MSARRIVVLAGTGDLADEAIAALAAGPVPAEVVPLPPRAGVMAGAGAALMDPAALVAMLAATGATHVTMVGRVDLPADARGRIAASSGSDGLGDLGLMAAVARLFQTAGISLMGIHEAVPHLLAREGLLAGTLDLQSLGELPARAIAGARTVGRLELGQGIVMGNGRAIAAEDAGGTDDLLRRVAVLRHAGLAGGPAERLVLAKALKPGQPLFVDLPTIGPETVRLAAAAGLAAIVVEADRSLIVARAEVRRLADELGVAVIGARASD